MAHLKEINPGISEGSSFSPTRASLFTCFAIVIINSGLSLLLAPVSFLFLTWPNLLHHLELENGLLLYPMSGELFKQACCRSSLVKVRFSEVDLLRTRGTPRSPTEISLS
ncbi:hypothetical protein COLO4_01992 [Corchorus olitorius]|uniref:Uncharacterized protein n=1 Tax=Corchorus olitorius TaxID=93759 RepID=A0A1R3L1T8_9ROSI|nr:hypothetical protein COLO4_01992 [Corchorus olitorius]